MTDGPAAAPLTFAIERTGETVVVLCQGKLVSGQTEAFHSSIRKLIPGSRRIVLDLTELTRMDSMGLGAVVRLYVSAKSAGSTLELINMGKQVRDLLGVTQLLSVLALVGEHNIRLG